MLPFFLSFFFYNHGWRWIGFAFFFLVFPATKENWLVDNSEWLTLIMHLYYCFYRVWSAVWFVQFCAKLLSIVWSVNYRTYLSVLKWQGNPLFFKRNLQFCSITGKFLFLFYILISSCWILCWMFAHVSWLLGISFAFRCKSMLINALLMTI
jgi:hypothetical protein